LFGIVVVPNFSDVVPEQCNVGTPFEVFTAQPQGDDGTNPSQLTTIADETSALQIAFILPLADAVRPGRDTLVRP
jgi:hypothetical protein